MNQFTQIFPSKRNFGPKYLNINEKIATYAEKRDLKDNCENTKIFQEHAISWENAKCAAITGEPIDTATHVINVLEYIVNHKKKHISRSLTNYDQYDAGNNIRFVKDLRKPTSLIHHASNLTRIYKTGQAMYRTTYFAVSAISIAIHLLASSVIFVLTRTKNIDQICQ